MNLEGEIKDSKKYHQVKEASRSWYKRWWGVLVLFILYIIVIFVLAFSFFIFKIANNQEFRESYLLSQRPLDDLSQKEVEDENTRKMRLAIVEGNNTPYLGNKEAEISIIIFSDFNCSYCREAAKVIASLSVKYGQDIKIIVRDFAVLNDESVVLATVAQCAGEQGKYWPMYYKLFELQGQIDLDNPTSLARLVGVGDLKTFTDCLDSGKYDNLIIQTMSDGHFLGIRGTPAWFLNGEKIHEGMIPFESFSELLDKLILYKNSE